MFMKGESCIFNGLHLGSWDEAKLIYKLIGNIFIVISILSIRLYI